MYHEGQDRGPVVGPPELLARFPGLGARLLRQADALFPVRVTRSWLARVKAADDPLGRQALPGPAELVADEEDRVDPVGEGQRSPVPWVVQKHADRALLLLTRRCHLYCRYCFRRAPHEVEDPSTEELERALAWIAGSGARELILSGGDPLAVSDRRLFAVMARVRPAVPVVRMRSRAPITAPSRVTAALVEGLRARAPVWVIVHCNHPDELSPEVDQALGRLVDAGVPVLNQAVLLAGVNDDADTLVALFEALLRRRVFPYYLHHPDHAPGNAAFRLDPARGLALYRAVAGRVSGLALPRYVIDPPDGLGKLDVADWLAAGGRRPLPSAAAPPLRS